MILHQLEDVVENMEYADDLDREEENLQKLLQVLTDTLYLYGHCNVETDILYDIVWYRSKALGKLTIEYA